MSRRSQLLDAMHRRTFVRISRRFEESVVRGYISGVGPRFFLLTLVSDRLRFDGFECFRIADLMSLEEDPYASFAEAALKTRGDRRPRKPRIILESIEELLLSSSRAFPLVTIHQEKLDPEVCHIGRVVGISRGRVSLLEITPDAEWESKPDLYAVKDITRVNFGGDYEDALYAVGGNAG
ncbi:hypothetical protein [Ramlibacter sp. WS9]|uniref:hypothetical protein n=1 Tax=Ramlibacter sp. WS9 TaxID=1882741 RepID=UPI001141FA6B|nr:hypothetical protein [Ramlibacter sp. WS9]ROZ61448.1 hypothetical protein EEB15_32695 [Ramlibacter sp. WS9]